MTNFSNVLIGYRTEKFFLNLQKLYIYINHPKSNITFAVR